MMKCMMKQRTLILAGMAAVLFGCNSGVGPSNAVAAGPALGADPGPGGIEEDPGPFGVDSCKAACDQITAPRCSQLSHGIECQQYCDSLKVSTPSCELAVQNFLACLAHATISCDETGTIQTSDCRSEAAAAASCAGAGESTAARGVLSSSGRAG
jgi:hypothetical protein